MQMQQNFETTQMTIMIEETTYSKSGFGVTDEGKGVFFNSRLMGTMSLKPGMLVTGHCIPNYEDKRDKIPYRCVRVSDISSLCPEVTTHFSKKIDEFMSKNKEFWTIEELSCELDMDVTTIKEHLETSQRYRTTAAYLWQ
mgnify:CR=1 FL=1